MKGVESAPGACPECGEDDFIPFYVMESKKSKLSCGDYNCDYEYISDFAAPELIQSERSCHSYDCGGDLELVEPELYRCVKCGRYSGLATTSRGTVYTTSVCPLCLTTSARNMDFHHWDYEDDVGIYVCRGCHEKLHGGKTVTEQTENAPHPFGWETIALANLKHLHKERHGDINSLDHFRDRYNLPEKDVYGGRAIRMMDETELSDI